MSRIIKSLFKIIAVAAAAGGASYSFFSDKETSVGNTFTAGNVDLKVDSTAHYDGLVCQAGKWVDQSGCKQTGDNLISNGSFEKPTVTDPQKWDIFPDGTTDLDWKVKWVSSATTYQSQTRPEKAQLELQRGAIGAAADGDQNVEMDTDWLGPNNPLDGEPASVSISQDIPTVAGEKYILKYKFSPRPNTDASENKLAVRIDDAQVDLVTMAGGANIDWSAHEYTFTAGGSSTKIEFADLGTPDSLGALLDAVEVYKLDCTETQVKKLIGTPCDESWATTDLGPTNKFFNFTDIKPGDQGENTVSLHVDNNDAYSCLMIHNVKNNENDLTQPEKDASDTSNDPNGGELDKYLHFFAWADDGDNIWEAGEQPLFDPQIGSGKDLLAGKVYPLNTGTDPLLAGTTRYIGLSWCVGTMTVDPSDHSIKCEGDSVGNDAQTDSFTADLTFYVEQARNNNNFVCPKITD